MPIFDASQIVGKTLFAAVPVALKRAANDSAPTIYTVAAGQAVGRVDSFVNPGAGRATLYWQFIDTNGRPYYAAHVTGRFSLSALKEQGALTVKQEQAQQEQAQLTTGQRIEKTARLLIWVIAGALVLREVVPALISKTYARN